MLSRPLLTAEVTSRQATRSLRIVGPEDFTTGSWKDAGAPPAGDLLPYCLDERNRRSIYCQGPGAEEALQAPFYYLRLRQTAANLLSSPWERGRIGVGAARRPCFIFSIGRCGSTLLVNALREGGALAVSEPDFLTQGVAAYVFRGPLHAGYAELSQTLRNLTDDLLSCAGSDASRINVIKLRAECCKAPRLIVGSEGSKTFFVIRRFRSWASSMLRVSNISPPRLVTRYIEGLRCLQWLKQNTECHLLTYEDLAGQGSVAFQDAARFIGLATGGQIRESFHVDSQAGTPLARRALEGRPAPVLALDQAITLWKSGAPIRLLDEVGLSDYCRTN